MDDVWKPPSYESQQPASTPSVWPHTPAAGRAGSRVPLVVALGVAVVGVVLAVVGILVTGGETAGYRTWHQQSRAMEPTYPEGSDVTVRPIDGSGVRRGDVVLFNARDWGADSVFMMRVIAVGGDHVVIDEPGRVSINGKALREPYLFKSGPYFTPPVEVTVPEGQLFLLGDHRTLAADSRAHYEHNGTIARSAVVGMAVDHASVPSPDRLWMWVGAATAAVGLVAAAVAATVRHRRTGLTPRI
ncbi:signal peptidase I [Streptomyces sp. NBC_01340]|uniref:signal peptidase I n=1 Tax=Streptomyces sp. NBC_01340 TaxID=2903830 RepID=UPI002E140CF4|nr:signal peptidase I [Streptomyces sp. NBC_01340]